jgi:hypothetical protein
MIERGKEKGFRRMVIAGAGAAGISAALCAAKRGLQVDLIEVGRAPGGTAVHGMLHTLAGFLDNDGHLMDSEICQELYDRLGKDVQKRKMGKLWVLQIEPATYGKKITNWLNEFSGINLHTDSKITELKIVRDAIEAAQVNGPVDWVVAGEGTAFVDTTGVAQLARLAGQWQAEIVNSYAVNFRFDVKGLSSADRAVRAALKLEIETLWPLKEATIWLDSGFTNEEFFLKVNFGGPEAFAKEFAAQTQSALPKTLSKIPRLGGFDNLRISPLLQRGGPRLKSKHASHPLEDENTFPVAWPYEFWSGPEVEIEMPTKIPVRFSEDFLRAADIGNLFAAGKCAGLPEKEMSAARVVGGCWAMGEQVAKITTRDIR